MALPDEEFLLAGKKGSEKQPSIDGDDYKDKVSYCAYMLTITCTDWGHSWADDVEGAPAGKL